MSCGFFCWQVRVSNNLQAVAQRKPLLGRADSIGIQSNESAFRSQIHEMFSLGGR